MTSGIKAFGRFLSDCRTEFHKITWPRRKELVESTWVVAAFIGLMGVFLFASDFILQSALNFVTSLGGK